jgi:hypothetical protein
MQCVRLVEVKDLDLGLSTSNRLHFCKVVPDSLITRVFFFFFFFFCGGGREGVGLWTFMEEGVAGLSWSSTRIGEGLHVNVGVVPILPLKLSSI